MSGSEELANVIRHWYSCVYQIGGRMSKQLTYEEIIEIWLREFISTMDQHDLYPGNRSGDELPGIKIIFDGYGYNEETNEEDDLNVMRFAVFVHKDSLTGEFPEHEKTPWALIHRPKDEVCISAIYDVPENQITVLPFEEEGSTELDHQFIYKLVNDIHWEHYDA